MLEQLSMLQYSSTAMLVVTICQLEPISRKDFPQGKNPQRLYARHAFCMKIKSDLYSDI